MKQFKLAVLMLVVSLCVNGIILGADAAQNALPETEKPFHFFLGGGFTIGGEKMASIYYETGSVANVRAGYLVEVKGGIEYRLSQRISLRGSFGVHFDQESAEQGNINFTRFPLEGLVIGRLMENLNFGAGIRKTVAATLAGTDDMERFFGSYDLESSVGFVVEAEYRFRRFGATLRFVSEKYRFSALYEWVNGSHVGLGLNYYFK